MRNRKRTASILIVMAAAFMMCFAATVSAASYQYKVTVSGGNVGEVTKTLFKVAYGDTVTIDPDDVTIKDSKYYLKGFHVSGQETPVVQAGDIPNITEDLDLVATYGIRQSMVRYTVRYIDAQDKELIAAKTFYGNVGDKPVLAFTYIEGYRPEAYSLTKTLTDNESENVFTFRYQEAEQSKASGSDSMQLSSTEDGAEEENNAAVQEDAEEPSDEGNEHEEDDAADAEEDYTADEDDEEQYGIADNADAGNVFQGGTVVTAGYEGGAGSYSTKEIVDLDEAAAEVDSVSQEKEKPEPNAGLIAAIAGAAVFIGLMLILFMKRRGNRE